MKILKNFMSGSTVTVYSKIAAGGGDVLKLIHQEAVFLPFYGGVFLEQRHVMALCVSWNSLV